RGGARDGSLYAACNRTVTPMGARLLREWLSQPMAQVVGIQQRQDAVQTWMQNQAELGNFRARLATVRDLERTASRLSIGTGNARDLIALRLSLEQIPGLRTLLDGLPNLCPTPLHASLNATVFDSSTE